MLIGKCPILWGQCNVVEDALRVGRYRDVFLHQWSIYDRSGRMIEDSGFFRAFPDHVSVGGPLTVDPPVGAPCLPDRDIFWLGLFQEHVGHFLVGTLSRLWALAQHADGATRIAYVGSAEPEALFGIEYIRLCLEALGVRQEQLLRVEGPMRFPCLTIAEPSFVENFSAAPIYGRMMRAIGDRLVGEPPSEIEPAVDVWLSKALITSGNRIVVNESALTDALARHGFVVEHPERLGFLDQLRFWSRSRLAMGFSSSAFHTTAFRGGQQICTISNNIAASSNQALLDRVCGNRSLFLQVFEGLREEVSTTAGFVSQMVISDPVKMADELARIADAFRARRISPQTSSNVPRHLWKARSGPMAFANDMSGQGERSVKRVDGRITSWEIGWKHVRSICAVTLSDRAGSTDVGSVSIRVSGDCRAWTAFSSADAAEVRADGPGATVLTYRVGNFVPARFLRIEISAGAGLDVGEIAVFGERLDPEVGLPDALMRAVLAQRAKSRSSKAIARVVGGTLERLGALIPRRLNGRRP